METIGHIATVVMLGCLVWGLLGLFRPRLVLWWAWPSVQTRWKALAFALLASIAFFLVVVAARPSSDKWMWFLPMLKGALISTIIEKWATPVQNPTQADENAHRYADMTLDEKQRYNASLSPEELAAQAHARVQAKVLASAKDCAKAQKTELPSDTDADWDKFEAQSFFSDSTSESKDGDADNEADCPEWDEDNLDRNWKKFWNDEIKNYFKRVPTTTEEAILRRNFGGDKECLFNFRMYEARIRKGEQYCYIPPEDYYRPRFNALKAGGIATTSTAFYPEALGVLTFPQLRAVGKAAGLNKLGRDKATSCKMLVTLPHSVLEEAWKASGVALHDIFVLKII